MKKIRVGVYNFTCCEGCTIVLIEALNKRYDQWMKKIDFVDFRALKPFKEVHDTDIALVEGAISTEKEVEKLKHIRAKTKKLVAFGSAACMGFPSNQRNDFDDRKMKEIMPVLKAFHHLDKVSPLKGIVKVDDEILGCPVDIDVLIKKIDGYLKNA
ncbi:MAG: hypothetical protein AABW51_04420 [Nanoarchaeota archaeon]